MSKKDKKNKSQQEEVEILSLDEHEVNYPSVIYVRADNIGSDHEYFDAVPKAVDLINFGDGDDAIEIAEYKLVKTKKIKLEKTLVEVA
jgi:hypothetical protein